jgi:hypothetical protein
MSLDNLYTLINMFPILPKKCNCYETPTNEGSVCDWCKITTNEVCIGEINSCTGLEKGDSLTIVLQKWENFLCGIGYTQLFFELVQNNEEILQEFYTLANGAITCETITNCSTYTTTTTTTVAPTTTTTSTLVPTTTTTTTLPECVCVYFYNNSSLIQEITYINCLGVLTYDVISPDVTKSFCGCCGSANNPDVEITYGPGCVDNACVPTTTTTTTVPPTTTTTSTSSSSTTTTSTTTAAPTTTTTTTTINANLNWTYSKIPPSQGTLQIFRNGSQVLIEVNNDAGTIVFNIGDDLDVVATPLAITDTVELQIASASGGLFTQILTGGVILSPTLPILPGESPYTVQVYFYDITA